MAAKLVPPLIAEEVRKLKLSGRRGPLRTGMAGTGFSPEIDGRRDEGTLSLRGRGMSSVKLDRLAKEASAGPGLPGGCRSARPSGSRLPLAFSSNPR